MLEAIKNHCKEMWELGKDEIAVYGFYILWGVCLTGSGYVIGRLSALDTKK